MSIIEKQLQVQTLSSLVSQKRFLLIGENKGLKVADITRLRKNGRESEVYLKVMKNSLLRLALSSIKGSERYLVGQNIIALSDDYLTATRLIADFATLTKLIDFKAAYYIDSETGDSQLIDVSDLREISGIQSRESLYAKIAYAISQVCDNCKN